MLRPFGHPVACCCAKFETGQACANGRNNSQEMVRPFARGLKLNP